MADYKAVSRTSYFKTTDEVKLKELVSKLKADLLEKEDASGDKLFAFGAENILTDYEDDNEERVGIFEELQSILPNGEVVILQEVGHEKLRYLAGVAFLITNNNIRTLTLDDLAKKAAREMLSNPRKEIITEY